jgi:hypothetical protein
MMMTGTLRILLNFHSADQASLGHSNPNIVENGFTISMLHGVGNVL